MAALIASQGERHGIPHAVCCRALGVSESWFYKWRHGDRSPRRARREKLKAEIARLFRGHEGKRGSPMITADLHDLGWRVSKNTVAGLMREMGLAARPGRKGRKGTTRPGKGRWKAPDLIKRDFPAETINQTAPRSAPMRARSTWTRCWTWDRAGCWGSRWASITTPSWPTERW